MTHNEVCLAMKIPKTTEQDDVNPLRVAVNYEFRQNDEDSSFDYRMRAIRRCVNTRLSFWTDSNTVYSAAKAYIKVQCPDCNRILEGHGGGSTHNNNSINYQCKCGTRVTLTLPDDGVHVSFPLSK